MSDSIDDIAATLGLTRILRRSRGRMPHQPQARDVLPDPGIDLDAARARVLAGAPANHPPSRRDFADQLVRLQIALDGQPEIMLWHALAISYLRRDTPHTDKARALFFRIWDEHGDWMAAELSARWLISTLQTFADHGRTPEERLCGTAGFLYGNLVKAYESEINSAYRRRGQVGRFKGAPVRGMHGFQPGHDILLNINAFTIAQADGAGPAGAALLHLVARVKAGETIFARVDQMVREAGPGPETGYLSFGDTIDPAG